MNEAPSTTSLQQRFANISKWLWMVVILIGFGVYCYQNFDTIGRQLQQTSWASLVQSAILLIVGRLLIIVMTGDVLKFLSQDISFRQVFYMVATSDLAKYLPGSIWHFVGRVGYYRALDMPTQIITKAMLQENFWLIVSATLASGLLLLFGYGSWWGFIILPIWVAILYLWGRHMPLGSILIAVMTQLLMWVLIGLSFAVLLPYSLDLSLGMVVSGAFVLSWLVGFLAIFAPGGIGVREVVLIAILLPLLPDFETSVFVLLHRLLWIITEFIFSLVAWAFFNLKSH